VNMSDVELRLDVDPSVNDEYCEDASPSDESECGSSMLSHSRVE
jgi:hypothetical protein